MNYQELIEPVVALAIDSGDRILEVYATDFDVQSKADESPLTQADLASNETIVAGLKSLTPDIPIISEEDGLPSFAERSQWKRYWLIDPLDGTKEFVNRNGEFTVNIALIEDRVPCFGLVDAPAASKLYLTLARDRAGLARLDAAGPAPDFAALEFMPLATRAPPAEGMTAAVSRSHLDAETQKYLTGNDIAHTRASGSSMKFCCLAEGQADVYPRFGRTMEWDIAAGHAVLAAAGGTVLTIDGTPFLYCKSEKTFANPGFIAWGRA